MPFGVNDQGQTVWYDEGQPMPQGVHATWTPSMGGSYTPSHTDYQSRYLNNWRAGSAIESMLGVKPGQYATVGGEVKNKGLWERYTESPLALALTAFGGGIGIPALLAAGAAGGAGAGGAALLPNLAAPGSSIYGGLAAAGLPGAASAGAIGGAAAAGAAAGGAGGAGAAGSALLPNAAAPGSSIYSGLAAPHAAALLPNAAAPGSAVYGAAAGSPGSASAGAIGGGARAMGDWARYIPALVNLFSGLIGSRETSAEKAQADALRQQTAYLQYQQQKQKSMDPVQDALIRMAMGLMPTYSQGLFSNYQGLPGVGDPSNYANRSMVPGIGGGGYGPTSGATRTGQPTGDQAVRR